MSKGPWKRALVTGASSGIGREIARQLAARGADVVAVARRQGELQALAVEVEANGDQRVEVMVADLTDSADLARVEQRVADAAAPIDLVVNNAGFGAGGPLIERSIDLADGQVRLNVLALTRLSHAALATMVPRGRGGLLNVSSVAGFQALPGSATYAASKAFVTSFTEALHEEMRDAGVHVTALCPGFTRTEFQEVAKSDPDSDGRQLPGVVWMSAEAVARAGLDAVARNDTVCVPGLGYKILAGTTGVLPRGVVRLMTRTLTRRA